ncbi:MAG: RdgB/HAM1 family non-canonical purine NTP pyrophosphatase [Myxococcota bacterium]
MSAPVLLVATGNPGKLREIRSILADLPVRWHTLADHPEVRLPEEGDDYADNAVAKALAAARASGLRAVADDSGLEVSGLGGRPGPHSARYGGPGLDDAGRVAHLLGEMQGLAGAARDARFRCVAALATPDGRVATAEGVCPGRILEAPRGDGGFGYDPVFWSSEHEQPMAELSEEQKNRISHRGRAFQALRSAIEAEL